MSDEIVMDDKYWMQQFKDECETWRGIAAILSDYILMEDAAEACECKFDTELGEKALELAEMLQTRANESDVKGVLQRGKESSEAYLEKLIEACEDWCGINAFDADKGACDEHNCDDDRGMNCSANELLDYIKEIITTLREDRE